MRLHCRERVLAQGQVGDVRLQLSIIDDDGTEVLHKDVLVDLGAGVNRIADCAVIGRRLLVLNTELTASPVMKALT
jgi:hypothetical protein